MDVFGFYENLLAFSNLKSMDARAPETISLTLSRSERTRNDLTKTLIKTECIHGFQIWKSQKIAWLTPHTMLVSLGFVRNHTEESSKEKNRKIEIWLGSLGNRISGYDFRVVWLLLNFFFELFGAKYSSLACWGPIRGRPDAGSAIRKGLIVFDCLQGRRVDFTHGRTCQQITIDTLTNLPDPHVSLCVDFF